MIGIGGIGMSGLAQMLKWQGCEVSGSDREIDKADNSGIFDSLTRQGIKLFPQNGSYIREFTPDSLIFSSAIEDDNPDFKATPALRKFHRAETLAAAVDFAKNKNSISIAVTGSSGKTTVTAWLAETLYHMGLDPLMLAGGLANRFISKELAGNFRPGNGEFIVYEADESDKSLLTFEPDYAVILNIGTDHYPHAELLDVFTKFLSRVKKGAVLEENVYQELNPEDLKHLDIALITKNSSHSEVPLNRWRLSNYKAGTEAAASVIKETSKKTFDFKLPLPGYHSAINALAVLSTLDILGLDSKIALCHISKFKGVWRRFDYAGTNSKRVRVYDDYAHNVEKIVSCIKTAKEIAEGKVISIFQPHGFKPLEFMRGKLFGELEKNLSENDIFIFLPVYYAGGTTSFQPEAEEVVQGYRKNGKKQYLYFSNRSSVESYLRQAEPGDVIVIMGARDNSLSAWAKSLAKNKRRPIL